MTAISTVNGIQGTIAVDETNYVYTLVGREIRLNSIYRHHIIYADKLIADANKDSGPIQAPGNWQEQLVQSYISTRIEEYIRTNFHLAHAPFRLYDVIRYRGYEIEELETGRLYQIQPEGDGDPDFMWSEDCIESALESIDYKIEESMDRMTPAELADFAGRLIDITFDGEKSASRKSMDLAILNGCRAEALKRGKYKQIPPNRWGMIIVEYNFRQP